MHATLRSNQSQNNAEQTKSSPVSCDLNFRFCWMFSPFHFDVRTIKTTRLNLQMGRPTTWNPAPTIFVFHYTVDRRSTFSDRFGFLEKNFDDMDSNILGTLCTFNGRLRKPLNFLGVQANRRSIVSASWTSKCQAVRDRHPTKPGNSPLN